MRFVLRAITKSKWYNSTEKIDQLLKEGRLQADALNSLIQAGALNDLKTTGNTLSVWYIDATRSNLQQVIVALAANRNNINPFDYVLLKESTLSALDIRIKNSLGDTPDDKVNTCHCELVELSLETILKLVSLIRTSERVRVPEAKIRQQLLEAVSSRRLSLDRMNSDMANSIDKMRQQT